jgi:hypothetical protein
MVPKQSTNVAVVKPSSQFEFFRVGSILKWQDWKVPVLDKTNPVTFEVDARLMQHDRFGQAFTKAVKYWNEAAGVTLINPKAKVVDDSKFSPRSSQIILAPVDELDEITLAAKGDNFADSVTGEILALKIDVFNPEAEILTWVLAHEMGHSLSLFHNFAASADPLKGSLGSTSIMDYITYDDLKNPDLAKVLPYDRAAMRYLYQGEKPNQKYLHCNDEQVPLRLDCNQFYDLDLATTIRKMKDIQTDPTQKLIMLYFQEKSAAALKPLEDRIYEPTRENFTSLHMGKIPHLTSALKHLWYNRDMTTEDRNRLIQVTTAYLEKLKAQDKAKQSVLIQRELDIYLGYISKNPFEP